MEIKILGSGCAKCKKLAGITEEAIRDIGLQANITKVEDMMDIMSYGVVRTPALIINEKVILSGRVPSLEELKELISQHG
ncbi:MAG: thioredoxin family protein [Bacteroidales bacterium]